MTASATHDDSPRLFSQKLRDDLFRKRVLVLDGGLDDDNGTVLVAQLLSLAADSDQDIALWIHSPGGSCPRCSPSVT